MKIVIIVINLMKIVLLNISVYYIVIMKYKLSDQNIRCANIIDLIFNFLTIKF
jgi:hypothetical protein